MQPLRIRIERIVDFTELVSLVGIDIETGMPVTIHVDHRPFTEVYPKLQQGGLPDPIEYAAERLLLRLDMLPAGNADTARFIELNGSDRARSGIESQPCWCLDR